MSKKFPINFKKGNNNLSIKKIPADINFDILQVFLWIFTEVLFHASQEEHESYQSD